MNKKNASLKDSLQKANEKFKQQAEGESKRKCTLT